MPEHRRKYSPEFREQAVRLVIDTSPPIATGARAARDRTAGVTAPDGVATGPGRYEAR
jgi:transposase-like protein